MSFLFEILSVSTRRNTQLNENEIDLENKISKMVVALGHISISEI